MSKRFSSITRMAKLACCVAFLGQSAQAADFSAPTREAVLQLTAEIQATQFLTHATFGPTEAEITALAAQIRTKGTIKAASDWIDSQMNNTTTPMTLHNPKEASMVDSEIANGALYVRTGTLTSNYTYESTADYNTRVSPTTPLPTVPGRNNAISRTKYRQHAWWDTVVQGDDQLRQKTAWTLYQIFAVSENAVNFNEEEIESTVTLGPTNYGRYQGLTNYYDIFVKNAFGKYREVLGRVTYHAIMGDWLSFRGNKKEANGVFPDENYAREVMQLFTIGLYVLNDSGEQEIISGDATPTYDADDIRELAQVFTGLGYGGGQIIPTSTAYSPYTTGTVLSAQNTVVKFQVAMRMFGGDHDQTEKVLLDPTGSRSLTNRQKLPVKATAHTEATANAEIDSALNGLVNHVSCPPFIAGRFIQRMVKSNPSKGYIQRVVNAFKSGTYSVGGVVKGSGTRGDLVAVVNAVLLDQEAFQPIVVSYQRGTSKFIVSTKGSEDSRLQEPVLNYTRFLRFYLSSATPPSYHEASGSTYASATTGVNSLAQLRFGSRDAEFDQSPYQVPSVFNFYVADFQPSGAIVSAIPTARIPNGVLVAPEFQIVTAITSNTTPNFYRTLITSSTDIRSEGGQTLSTNAVPAIINNTSQYENTADITYVVDRSTRCIATFDYTAEINLTTSDTNIDLLVERLDKLLCGGTLNTQYRDTLKTLLKTERARLAGNGLDISDQRALAKAAVLAIVTAPSFLVTE